MSNELVRELGRELSRENVALWLGLDWQPPSAEELTRLAERPWLGVWAESRRPELAIATRKHSQETPLSRLVTEVPDRVQDVIGDSFGIAGIAPYLYLHGRLPDPPEPDPYEREERRRDVLAAIAGLKPTRVHDTVTALHKSALAVTDHAEPVGREDDGTDRRAAPAAFYTARQTVALRHSGFGRMILDWLKGPGETERRRYEAVQGVKELLEHFDAGQDVSAVQINLLKPVLQRLGHEQLDFIEYLAMRFLRLQWRQDSSLDRWKQECRAQVYDVVD
jgi:hypothetical protein